MLFMRSSVGHWLMGLQLCYLFFRGPRLRKSTILGKNCSVHGRRRMPTVSLILCRKKLCSEPNYFVNFTFADLGIKGGHVFIYHSLQLIDQYDEYIALTPRLLHFWY